MPPTKADTESTATALIHVLGISTHHRSLAMGQRKQTIEIKVFIGEHTCNGHHGYTYHPQVGASMILQANPGSTIILDRTADNQFR